MIGVERWMVFGGSWGSTLALAYSESHPERVTELVVRGIYTLTKAELDWYYQFGVSEMYPDRWEKFIEPVPESERHEMMAAYHRRLTSENAAVRREAARAWSIWEGSTSKLLQSEDMVARYSGDHFAEAFARIENHYFVNGGFFRSPNQLLEDVGRIRHIPGIIIQGRYDVVCPMKSAWDLHRAWPEAALQVVADAGHAASEHGTLTRLIEAADHFARL